MKKRTIALAIVLALLTTLVLPLGAMAATLTPVSLAPNASTTVYPPSGTTVTSVWSNNESIVRAYGYGSYVTLTAGAYTGTAMVTISHTGYYGYPETSTVSVTVVGSTAPSGSVIVAVGGTEYSQEYYQNLAVSSDNPNICQPYFINNRIRLDGRAVGSTIIRYNGTNWSGQPVNSYFTVQVGGSNTIQLNLTVGQMDTSSASYPNGANVASNNSAVASAWLDSSTKRVIIRGESAGTAQVVVSPFGGNAYTANVSVTGTGSGSVLNYNIDATVNENTPVTGSYSNAGSFTSSNPSVATASLSGTTIYVKGNGAGSTVITGQVIPYGANTWQNMTLNVTVKNTSSGGTTSTTTKVPVNTSSSTSQTFYSIDSIYSSNSAIATAAKTSDNRLQIRGISPGTAKITATVKDSAYANSYTFSVDVEVTGSSSGGGGGSSTSGVYLGTKKTYSVSRNKKYSLGTVKLDGSSLGSSSRNKLLWVSSDTDVVTVDKYGKFTTRSRGTANIVALTKNGDQTAYVTVIVN